MKPNLQPADDCSSPLVFHVQPARDVASAERLVWCVGAAGREMGRFPNVESALRAAMAYGRSALQKGEAVEAIISRTRPDGVVVNIHVVPYR
jgi:hypothetical protein